MPAPGQMAPHRDNAHFAKMLEALNDKSEPNLAHEVAELRKEIAALRAELAPVPSLIVTGRQALDEFKRLQIPGQTRGYQCESDTWRIEGVTYSAVAMRWLAKAQGETYRVTRTGETVTLERVQP